MRLSLIEYYVKLVRNKFFFQRLLLHVGAPRHGLAPAQGAAALAGFLLCLPAFVSFPRWAAAVCVQTRVIVLHPPGASGLEVSLPFTDRASLSVPVHDVYRAPLRC